MIFIIIQNVVCLFAFRKMAVKAFLMFLLNSRVTSPEVGLGDTPGRVHQHQRTQSLDSSSSGHSSGSGSGSGAGSRSGGAREISIERDIKEARMVDEQKTLRLNNEVS